MSEQERRGGGSSNQPKGLAAIRAQEHNVSRRRLELGNWGGEGRGGGERTCGGGGARAE